MIARDWFINKIRQLGFTFKGQQKRTYLWRQRGGFVYISIPKADLLEDEFVTSSLRHAGLNEEEIKQFIGAAKS